MDFDLMEFKYTVSFVSGPIWAYRGTGHSASGSEGDPYICITQKNGGQINIASREIKYFEVEPINEELEKLKGQMVLGDPWT